MQREQAMSYFRKLAKLLHPDKNHHPMAKEAFQKFSEAVQVVSSSSSSQPPQSSSSF
jgi:DnaJ-class molecular chaperone